VEGENEEKVYWTHMTKGSSLILRLYFAVVSAVTLFTLMFGLIDLVTLGLKTYVITAADVPDYLQNCANLDSRYYAPVDATVKQPTAEEQLKQCEAANADSIANYERTKASAAVRDIALILVTLPLFLLHFKVVYRDWVEERKNNK
jgi:hypothetical protein